MDSKEINNVKEKKFRKMEKSSTKETPNVPLKKQLLKDLRVKVERISSEGSSDQSEKEDKDEKDDISKIIKKKTPETRLPVIHEISGEISSSSLQGTKKEGSQEDMVTSSCQESRTKCVSIQTEQVQSENFPGKVIFKFHLILYLFI